PQIINRPQN
nr:Chain B, Peptidase [Shewanella oneidensis]3NJF_B Chain B, Peptidase [Shewanella oneidensis]3NJF_D Chain D, Peptidase [Shewanella oneidensis]3NJG_B Chain B, Peptidase [Shewanella oneidensis]3NJI_B Chain B, Peptidase [Shewanella oneidensis]3NJJ_B Chain B, Peptidase [Shewanella oneidensis]